jgi:methylase of polypeptide subunit release factors
MVREIAWQKPGQSDNQSDGQSSDQMVVRNWISESEIPLPKNIILADETLTVDSFLLIASQGSACIWQGDFQLAKQLLQSAQKRIDQDEASKDQTTCHTLLDQFLCQRRFQAHKAHLLSRLLICVDKKFKISLQRAPDVSIALGEALGTVSGDFVIGLRELLGIIGAHEWRKKGMFIPALGNKIHPHYGVFSPVRSEYLELIEKAPIGSSMTSAFDIGTGTGVIAALLAKRRLAKIVATDVEFRAVACAKENISRLGFADRIRIEQADIYPIGKADLIVCNPPWLPSEPSSPIEKAVYDKDSQMLKGFLNGAGDHLTGNGEAWLVLSNFAELLGLRAANELETLIKQANLKVIDRLETKPNHPKSMNADDPLYHARSREITMLWRLGPVL